MNKKAQTQFNIFMFIVVAFLAVIFFGSLIWVMGLINNVMTDVGIQNDEYNIDNPLYVNMTSASEQTFGQVNQSIQALRIVSFMYILGFAVVIIITAVLSSKHPIWFFINVLVTLLAVLFSPTVSNAYEDLLNTNIMDGVLSTFTASNFVVLNLPIFVMIIGFAGGVFALINMVRTNQAVGEL